jgi:hypothetical protein
MPKQTADGVKQTNLDHVEAFELALRTLNDTFSATLRSLLETKHLYQNVLLSYDEIRSSIRNQTISAYHPNFDRLMSDLAGMPMLITPQLLFVEPRGQSRQLLTQIQLVLGNIKLHCAKCGRLEAFKLVAISDIVNDLARPSRETNSVKVPRNFQLWLLTFQCQSCMGAPEALLVRRDGWKLHLEGRSPIEDFELPVFLPKVESHWFRDAVVARNSGKVLAALFYLRTFIEQFARRQTKMEGKYTGEEIMSAYNALLPEPQRNFMPSLKEWYENISAALHGAVEDADLFENARGQIERHFDFRRMYNIAEVGKN